MEDGTVNEGDAVETYIPDDEPSEPSVIVQLSNRVQDGTRCRPGSLDMCIQGKCQVTFLLSTTFTTFSEIILFPHFVEAEK